MGVPVFASENIELTFAFNFKKYQNTKNTKKISCMTQITCDYVIKSTVLE